MRLVERELTERVALTDARGRLNPDAVGWTRQPLHDTSGIGRGFWPRNKRWEYWSFVGPRFIVGLTVSAVDYAGIEGVWVFDRETKREWKADATIPLARGVELPPSLGEGPARVTTKTLSIEILEEESASRIRFRIPGVDAELVAVRPAGHEVLGVVVPWSTTRFQYTVKDVARPATGTITFDGIQHAIDDDGDAWAVLDHGRGRWPYDVTWNWAAGSGAVDGRRIGIQLGAKWADGTGSTENALFVDGRAHKVSEELTWDYDTKDFLAPWQIHGELADLTFTPFYDKVSRTQLVVLASATDQCFGHWTGWMADDAGSRVRVDGAIGWAEHVHNRW